MFPSYLTVSGNSVPVGFVNYLPHSAQSNYHAALLRLEKRFNGSLSVLSSYTFSKAITNAPQFRNAGGADGSENSPAQDAFNLQAERGLASFHLKHRWVTSGVYNLPSVRTNVAPERRDLPGRCSQTGRCRESTACRVASPLP